VVWGPLPGEGLAVGGGRVEGGVGLVGDVEQPLAQHLRGHEKQAPAQGTQYGETNPTP